MPDWIRYAVTLPLWLAREAFKMRFFFGYLKDLGILGSKYRAGFVKDYSTDYEIIKDASGKEKTKFEIYLEKHPKVDSVLTRISKGFKWTVDKVTSPLFCRALYFLGAGIGVALVSSNPVSLGIALAGAAVASGAVGYGMYRDVKRFREQRKLQEERAILEEMMLLKTQSKAIATQVFGTSPETHKLLGLAAIGATSPTWKKINKTKVAGRAFLEQLPESTIPMVASLATGNFLGFGIALSGNFLEACGKASRGIAYTKEKERLLNTNSSLAHNLGLGEIEPGQRNADLRTALAEMRARKQALFAVNIAIKENYIDSKDAGKYFVQYYESQLKKVQQLSPPSQEKTWWQDAKKVLFKEGISFAKTFRNFSPMIDEYREEYKTKPISHSTVKQEVHTKSKEQSHQKSKTPLSEKIKKKLSFVSRATKSNTTQARGG